METVLGRLRDRIESGHLQFDEAQIEAAKALDDLLLRLKNAPKGGLFRKPKPVRGLYMWGGVGRGKSMLMDSFYGLSPLPAWRVHFHEFMGRVHDKLAKARARSDVSDPIPPVAKELAEGIRVLCFDEFQVTQIADAMILSRLFEHLFELRVTVIATSNRPPDDLYKNGLNRELFTPFIDLLKQECDVLELAASRDYRLERLSEEPVWHKSPAGPALDRAFERLTLGAEPQSCDLSVQGRHVRVEREAAGVARFGFDELCARPLGSRDFLTIAATFHTVILEDIPQLTPDKRNEAARFVALIDALYEARVKLVASAATEPEQLYVQGTGSFEFQRTASRLHEMRSTEYMAEEHKIPDLS